MGHVKSMDNRYSKKRKNFKNANETIHRCVPFGRGVCQHDLRGEVPGARTRWFRAKKGEEIVECKSVRDVSLLSDEEWEKMPKVSILGIGMVDKESKRFPLFPRFVNETIYRPATCEKNKLPIVFGCGKKFASAIGLRVEDCKCFEKLSVMLKVAAKEPFMGEVKDMEEKVEMISEMLIMDKDLEKRFLWGGWGLGYHGFGLGYGGLGWGGLGWGWGGLGGWGWGK